MTFPVYQHFLTVSDKRILPSGPLDCGMEGDHMATRLTFEPLDQMMQYHFEVVCADGTRIETEPDVTYDGALSIDIPSDWTAAGVLTMYLVEEDSDGKEVYGRRYFPPVTLRFAQREGGSV